MESNIAVPAILLGLVAILLVVAAVHASLRALSRIRLHRSILVHVPVGRAWTRVSDLPYFLSTHGRVRGAAAIDDWSLREGDGRAVGSVWRGTARDRSYWLDLQITRREPGDEIGFRLMRDSHRTHRALRRHQASIKLREVRSGMTKITWELHARLRGARLRLLRLFSPSTLNARLLDIGLRTVKASVETLAEEPNTASAGGPMKSPRGRAVDETEAPTISPFPPTEPPEANA